MAISAGSDILASDFISSSAGAADAGKSVKLGADGKLDLSFIKFPFGGSGADGALNITSGTTTIDLGGAAYFEKNYTSINISGTGALAFSNPNSKGTFIVLRSQGNVTITSSATRAIDLRSLGGAGGAGGASAFANGANGSDSDDIFDTADHYGAGGSGDGATGGAGGAAFTTGSNFYSTTSSVVQSKRMIYLVPGAGGGGGEAGNGVNFGAGGAGGRGAGSLFIECGGAYNCTGTIDASGINGTTGSNSGASSGGGGGGGGGAAGMILVMYGSLTADSGTYTVSGGSAGGGGTGSGGSGGAGGGGAGMLSVAGGNGVNNASSSTGGAGGAGKAGVALRIANSIF